MGRHAVPCLLKVSTLKRQQSEKSEGRVFDVEGRPGFCGSGTQVS